MQGEIFLSFMDTHPDLAKGFGKGDKISQEELWKELVKRLNSSGPPTKAVSSWKKAWSDWKLYIKCKLWHKQTEVRKTGGGAFNQYVLTQVEEQIAQLCGLYTAVEGIPNTKSFGCSKKENIAPSTKTSSPQHGESETPTCRKSPRLAHRQPRQYGAESNSTTSPIINHKPSNVRASSTHKHNTADISILFYA